MTLNHSATTPESSRFFNRWTVAAIVLLAVIIAGSAVIWARHGRGRGLEISIAPEKSYFGQIYVGGDVNDPGIYPLRAGDTINDVLEAAGGPTASADPAWLALTVAGKGETVSPQKVDINRAEAWLLAALPGIGPTRAQDIIDYRRQHGPFRDINELLEVPGIGDITFENIKSLITVGE
jgi:competence protein ComEA